MKDLNKPCIFCSIKKDEFLFENNLAYASTDSYPVSKFHSLVVPKRCIKNFFELENSTKELFKKYDELLFEQYIGGQEIQVAILNNTALGSIELVPKRSFYDYKAKYTKSARTKHIMPARLKKNEYARSMQLAKKAHNALGCKGVTRTDFKFFKNKFYLLEINTQPGMTNLSLVPEIANYYGISFSKLVENILLDASINR